MLTKVIYNDAPLTDPNAEIEVGKSVEYHCFNGMRGASNMSFTHQLVTCKPQNNWTLPDAWENCTDSKRAL